MQDETVSYFKDPKTGIGYNIKMISVETVLTSRQNWDKIPYFIVMVSTYTEPDEI